MLEFSFCGMGGGMCACAYVCVLPKGRCSFHLFKAVTEKKASTVYIRFVSPVGNHLFQLQSADLSVLFLVGMQWQELAHCCFFKTHEVINHSSTGYKRDGHCQH